ncbi:MAG: hypothetical protein FWG02_11865 [Holophagaceae bacterium]|nr:hypothetical protein [Holophagaceae bacterium]
MSKLQTVSKILLLAFVCAICTPLVAQKKQKPVAVVFTPVGSAGEFEKNVAQDFLEEYVFLKYSIVVRDSKEVDEEVRSQWGSGKVVPETAVRAAREPGASVVVVTIIDKEHGHARIRVRFINAETKVISEQPSSGLIPIDQDNPGKTTKQIREAVGKIAARGLGMVDGPTKKNRPLGLFLGVAIPMGDFAGIEYAPTFDFPVVQSEGYNTGFGGRFTMTFPLSSRHLAFRAGANALYARGTNTAPGYANIDLNYFSFGLSGELQLFFDHAYLHRGTYLFGGVTGGQEIFDSSLDESVIRKVRFGGTAGIGHTYYRENGLSFTMEMAYHMTLANKDIVVGDPVKADYLRLSLGFVW